MKQCPGCLFEIADANAEGCPDCELSLIPGSDLTVVEELRHLTNGWDVPPTDLRFAPATEGDPLIASLDICDAEHLTVLLTVGVHVTHDRITGDVLHNQLMTLPSEPTRFRLEVAGRRGELARAAAAWFRQLVAMPFERHEYDSAGRVEHRVVMADGGQGVVETRDCPPRQAQPDRTSRVAVRY
ncbi:hypothetical protein [Nocardioides sp. L-11A]|uniref:hypothetical protein n=1 Tax=Nocardioides sp. L-11A TaxID=3043848 RepID=UPI00249BEC77|nr:hypothetical protein QJ852_02240 [Nocardioides sp. L-11A]